MFEVEADVAANRLYLDLNGRMEAGEIEEAAEVTVDAAANLDPGFDILNDLAGFKPPSPEAAKPIKEAQAELKELGVDRVVRVIDDETSDIVVHAFERRSRDVGYSGETAETKAEAETLLEETGQDGYAGT